MKRYFILLIVVLQVYGLYFPVYAENLSGGTYTVNSAEVNTSTGTLQGGSYVMQADTLVISGATFGGSLSLNTGYGTTTQPVIVPAPPSGGGGGGGGGGGSSVACPVSISPSVVTDVNTGAVATISPPFGYSVLFGNVEYKTKTVVGLYPNASIRYPVDVLLSGAKYTSCFADITVQTSSSSGGSAGSCFPFSKNLKIGAIGPEVRRMQVFLQSRGYKVDKLGVFGKKTQAAVKQFQNKYSKDIIKPSGLKKASGLWYTFTIKKANQITGCGQTKKPVPIKNKVLNQKLVAKAASLETKSCQIEGKLYKIGSSGTEVKRIQKFLSLQGFDTPVTGVYDFETGVVVAKFQQKYFQEIIYSQGFSQATGIWGSKTSEVAKSLGLCAVSINNESELPVLQVSIDKLPSKSIESLRSCLVYPIKIGTVDSNEVRQIQRFLIAQGYSRIRETGNYVGDTIVAIKDFQNKYSDEILIPQGFDHATGVWGVGTSMKANKLGLCSY